MNQQEALQVLINGVESAQSRGAYSLEEASKLWEAVRMFTTPPSPEEELVKKPINSKKK